jgi:hypothetical protein
MLSLLQQGRGPVGGLSLAIVVGPPTPLSLYYSGGVLLHLQPQAFKAAKEGGGGLQYTMVGGWGSKGEKKYFNSKQNDVTATVVNNYMFALIFYT